MRGYSFCNEWVSKFCRKGVTYFVTRAWEVTHFVINGCRNFVDKELLVSEQGHEGYSFHNKCVYKFCRQGVTCFVIEAWGVTHFLIDGCRNFFCVSHFVENNCRYFKMAVGFYLVLGYCGDECNNFFQGRVTYFVKNGSWTF